MEKILIVPVDFSDNSTNALDYAINFANQFDRCTIHLIHVYVERSSLGFMASVNTLVESKMDKQLSETVEKVKLGLQGGTTLLTKAIKGYPIEIICDYAEEQKADYIIMGTLGASGLKRAFLGSNASGVMKNAKTPVIAIPAEFKYRPPIKIALAIDAEIVSSEDVLSPMIEIANLMDAKIEIVHVKAAKEMAVIDAGVDIYLSDVKHTFHVVRGDSINKEIDEFIQQNGMDMLCMIHRRHNFLHRLIFTSVTAEEMFNCKLPLLVLNDL